MAVAVGLGLVAGVAGSATLPRLARALLFGVQPFDPVSIASAVAIVLIASTAAAALPVQRAVRVDPATALRED
jgi:putative ABC transport system permease protein